MFKGLQHLAQPVAVLGLARQQLHQPVDLGHVLRGEGIGLGVVLLLRLLQLFFRVVERALRLLETLLCLFDGLLVSVRGIKDCLIRGNGFL